MPSALGIGTASGGYCENVTFTLATESENHPRDTVHLRRGEESRRRRTNCRTY